MKNLKKLGALLLTMIMVLSMGTAAMAATVPAATDSKEATVSNVEKGATVTAYKIVNPIYNTAGLIGYEPVAGVTIADVYNPTSDEITTIAKSDLSGLTSVSMTTTDETDLATFKGTLTAGTWLVLVSGSVNEVYNPMILSVYYSVGGSDNTTVAGTVDANSNWTLVTTDAYAKSTAPSIEKTVTSTSSDDINDVAIGDTVNYQIKTNIPSYSKEYTEVNVKIADALSAGLTLDTTSIVVAGVPADKYSFSKAADATGFEIAIDSAWALANQNVEVTVTYSATLNANAGINFDANTNTATLEYSNNPTNSTDTKKTESKTYTYTFGIDAKLNGESTDTWNKVTQEIVKGEMVKETVNGETKDVFKALAGATFTLTNNADAEEVYTSTSDENGALSFTGLDAGTYTLVETAAPEGYTINATEIPVVIEASYNTDGTLKSYSIKVDNKVTSTYTATYEGTGTTSTITEVVEGEANAATQILNTKISSLPSTGGIGTTIFTIGGCVIMIAAAGMFFASRKKEQR